LGPWKLPSPCPKTSNRLKQRDQGKGPGLEAQEDLAQEEQEVKI